MKYTVYIRTNVINGKQYVGQTSNIIQRNRDWNCLKKSYANPIIDSEMECSTKSISDCLRGKYKTCKGYKLYYEQQD